MLDNSRIRDIKNWCEAGKRIDQEYRDTIRSTQKEEDGNYLFSCLYQFAGQYIPDQLDNYYDQLIVETEDIPDLNAKSTLNKFTSLGRKLFVNKYDEAFEFWDYMYAQNILPGVDVVKDWLCLADEIVNSYKDQLKKEDVYLDFLNTYHHVGDDLFDFKAPSIELVTKDAVKTFSRLDKWVAQEPHTAAKQKVSSYLILHRKLFTSEEFNHSCVFDFLFDKSLMPDLSNEIQRCKIEQAEQKKRRIEELKRIKEEKSFWEATISLNKRSGYKRYLKKYPKGIYRAQAKTLLKKTGRGKRIFLIVILSILGLQLLPRLFHYFYNQYSEKYTCHTEEILLDPVFSTFDYAQQLSLLDSVLANTKRQKCVDELSDVYLATETMNNIMIVLDEQFQKPRNGRSLVEKSIRAKDTSEAERIEGLIAQGERISPNDDRLKGYRKTFEKLIKKYRLKLNKNQSL